MIRLNLRRAPSGGVKRWGALEGIAAADGWRAAVWRVWARSWSRSWCAVRRFGCSAGACARAPLASDQVVSAVSVVSKVEDRTADHVGMAVRELALWALAVAAQPAEGEAGLSSQRGRDHRRKLSAAV
jgi:hypothetical protein